jgi:hypothetical protein
VTAGKRWLLHPFAAGVYFVLTLAAANAAALHGWRDLLWPVVVSLVFCTVCWAIALALTRDPSKASLLSLLWVVAFSLFGYVAETLRPRGVLRLVGAEPGLVGLFALAVLGPSLAVARSSRRLEQVNRYLTLIGVLLVGYTGFRLYLDLRPGHQAPVPLPLPSTLSGAVDQPPDIYLIIPDKYTNSEFLAKHFGFDNSEFDRFLRDRGFVIPRHARANYPRTQLALASFLNLDYIQNLPPRSDLNLLIEHNRFAAFLKAQGYRFVFFPTPFKFTSQNRMADLQLPAPSEIES